MAYNIEIPKASTIYTREYTNLRGVDFSSLPSKVALNRSPDAKNVYKDYSSTLGQAIETRKGTALLGKIDLDIFNLISNWDFSDGTTGWQYLGLTTFQVVDGVLQCIASANKDTAYQNLSEHVAGNKYYVNIKFKATSSEVEAYANDGVTYTFSAHSGSGNYERVSLIKELGVGASKLQVGVMENRDIFYIDMFYVDEVIAINLTKLFGSGNEPAKADVDTWIEDFLDRETDKIYGIHVYDENTALIHMEKELYIWDSFPNEISSLSDIKKVNITMNDDFSKSFLFDEKLYILDGENYIVYDGSSTENVVGYIPTTSINAEYDGTGRTTYQSVNYISNYRKNHFIGDGSHATFTLDVESYDNEEPTATVNGSSVTVSSFNYAGGTVTLASNPAGDADVYIQFKKTTSGYADHIKKCTLCAVFDERVFLSGNNSYKGVLFHSELNDPTYFADDAWYDDGKDGVAIKSLIKSGNSIVVIKEDTGEGVKVYYHTSTYDSEYGTIYPVKETEIYLGACSGGINFMDSILFLSKLGLEYVYLSSSGSKIYHRSTFVDTQLVNESNISNASIEVWNNYLCILIDDKMYLADNKQMSNYEYEWYYWDNIGVFSEDLETLHKAIILKEYNNELFFGTENGHICYFIGTTDTDTAGNDVLINAYWTTPVDRFKNIAYLKTVRKRGSAAVVKRIPNSLIKIDVQTDKESWTNIKESRTSGFSFVDFSFVDFSFGTGVRGLVTFKAKKKKIQEFSLKFYSDEINKPFGLYEATLEYEITNYVK